MASQFIHLAGYGRKPRKGQARWECASGIAAEGVRLPHASKHVAFPAVPEILFGGSPLDVAAEAEANSLVAFDGIGRQLRFDGICFVAGVVSYPFENEALRGDPLERDLLSHWQISVVHWLKDKFSPHLKSIVAHNDERYTHLHFFLLPPLTPDRRIDLGAVHPGYAAKTRFIEDVVAKGGTPASAKRGSDRAYVAAMKAFQDEFHAELSSGFGHSRFSNQRERRERKIQLVHAEADRKLQAAREKLETEFRARADEGYRDGVQRARADHHQADIQIKSSAIEIDRLKRQIELLNFENRLLQERVERQVVSASTLRQEEIASQRFDERALANSPKSFGR
jgi:uncharacterized protein with FMN-binding domain